MTTPFYAPPDCLAGDRFALPDDEAHHAARVLRVRVGDTLDLVDGEGTWYRGRVDEVERGHVAGRLVERRADVGEPPYRLTVGLGVLKNPARFETFLEKAVETGVTEIVPLLTARTEKAHLKAHRAHNILVAAMKQSGRCRLTTLAPPEPLETFLRRRAFDVGLVCHEQTGPDAGILSALAYAPTLGVVVGPEGGFSDAEIEACRRAGFRAVSLGPRRLRAETAALVAAAAVMLHHAR